MTQQQHRDEFVGVKFRLNFASGQDYCHEATVSISPRPLLLKAVRTVGHATRSPCGASTADAESMHALKHLLTVGLPLS